MYYLDNIDGVISMFTIRASSLSHYSDCMRRSAAKMFPEVLADYGFKVNAVHTSIGAAVGTATHKALETGILLKNAGKDYVDEMRKVAFDSLVESIAEGIIWDDTTTNRDNGVLQAVRQARMVLDRFPNLAEVSVEDEFQVDLGDGFILSGHVDIRGRLGDELVIFDLKTGTVRRVNIAQYGAYSLLVRSHGKPVSRLGEIYIKRIGVTKPQPEPILTEYPVVLAESTAWSVINRIKNDVSAFVASGNPEVWLPNPNSMMCSPNYCPAFGTNFCKLCKEK